MSSLALDKIEEIKRLRREGLGYNHIAKRLKVSGSTAHNHGKVVSPETKRQVQATCRTFCKRKGLKCMRHIGHGGVHLSDETGKLIYWE